MGQRACRFHNHFRHKGLYVSAIKEKFSVWRSHRNHRDRRTGASSRRRGARDDERDGGAGDRGRPEEGDAGPRFLPADGQLSGEDLRGGPHPRRILQARRASHGEGNADLAPDRPADTAAVSGRLHQRRAGGCLGYLGEFRSGSRYRFVARRVGGAGDFRHAVHGSDRRGARRLHRRQVHPQSHQQRSWRNRSSTWSSPAPQKAC